MVKKKQNKKLVNGQMLYTSGYLQEQLFLYSDRQARNILANYESVEGKSPKLYTRIVMDKAISDWKSKPNNQKKLQERKEDWEHKRAVSEREFYEQFQQKYDSDGNHPDVPSGLRASFTIRAQERFDNELQLMMLKNLYTALGIKFDYDQFFTDLEIDIAYTDKMRIERMEFGNERPIAVIEAQERLGSDDSYLITR
ncbi:hypothetical protein HCC41_06455 [Streptococcus suis]|nr:hypothetical protein [Streptococcus suis]